ncbi:hypothetical protein QBC37DRAFT_173493 [Rhypophila decipiens]|uniref:Lysine decarboxylase-like protein n=1 Tax=Rhypophila decipiens TaxID=261697 RepID=A0AAN6Y8J7_9PEZI|nr:hypothetical protein QBC37DRAFT_173493 [Rhypophila decipiens]
MASGGGSPFPSVPASGTSTPSGSNLNKPTRICVYCGASPGADKAHLEAARDLARAMAANNIQLVYGGGTVGIMGEIAKTLVSLSGPDSVHGIIPEALVRYERDPNYTSTSTNNGNAESQQQKDPAPTKTKSIKVPEEKIFGRTTVVPDMHTRKRMMAQQVIEGGPGSGFIALSGGFGTLEELFETTTWNQLGIHTKGICVLNVNGFYDGILTWIKKAIQEKFIREGNADILVEAKTAEEAIQALRNYRVSKSVLKLAWGNS